MATEQYDIRYDIRIHSRYDIVPPPVPSWLAGKDVGRIAELLRTRMGFRRREAPNDVLVGHIGVTDKETGERSELSLYESTERAWSRGVRIADGKERMSATLTTRTERRQ